MRIVLLAAAAACLSFPALAADFDAGPLRGTQYAPPAVTPIMNWEGGYFGGFGGYSQANFSNKGALRDPVAFMLRGYTVENEFRLSQMLQPSDDDASDTSFGAFAGYNFQYDEAVLGFEVDFTRVRLSGVGSDFYAARVRASNGLDYSFGLDGETRGQLMDFASLRARAGITMGSFLPYVSGGIALARTEVTRFARVDVSERNGLDQEIGSIRDSKSLGPKEVVTLGYAAGVGVDVAVTPNLMLRAEYLYAHFNDMAGYRININNVRGGAAVKF
jgi:opacity protein-like surface antigen